MSFTDFVVKLVLSILTLSSITVLTYSLFKIPIKRNGKQIIAMGCLLGLTNFYFKFLLESPYHFLMLIVMCFVGIMIARKYPVLYALIVSLTGVLVAAVIDTLLSFTAILLNLSSVEEMQNSTGHFIFFNGMAALLYLLIAVLIVKTKKGFSFIVRRFKGKESFTRSNLIWAASLITGTFIAHIVGLWDVFFPKYSFMLAALYVIFIFILAYTWRKNKKVSKERYTK